MFIIKQHVGYYTVNSTGYEYIGLDQKKAVRFHSREEAFKKLKSIVKTYWGTESFVVKLKKKKPLIPKEDTVFLFADKPHIINQVFESNGIYFVDSSGDESFYKLKEYNGLIKSKIIKVIWEPET